MLCVLKGGYRFFADLQDELAVINSSQNSGGSIRLAVEFVRLKSYENAGRAGEVRIVGADNLENLKGMEGICCLRRFQRPIR